MALTKLEIKKEVPYFIRELNRLKDIGLSLGMQSSVKRIMNQLYSQSWTREVYNKSIQIPYIVEEKVDWNEFEREGE